MRILLTMILILAAAGCNKTVAGGRADGEEVFSAVCARCHGRDGEPTSTMVARLGVKPLTSDHVQKQLSDDEIRDQILHGSDNKQMPSFSGALSDAQIDAVIEYVRSLGPPETGD